MMTKIIEIGTVFISPAFRFVLQLYFAYVLTPNEFSEFVLVWTISLLAIAILTSQVLTFFFHFPKHELSTENQLFLATVILIFISFFGAVFLNWKYKDLDLNFLICFFFIRLLLFVI